MTLHWIIVTTDQAREARVAEQIRSTIGPGVLTYMPTALKTYQVRRGCSVRITREVPLIARVVFCCVPPDSAARISRLRYVRSLVRDSAGSLVIISDEQMQKFIGAHATWLDGERKRFQSAERHNSRPRRRKTIRPTIEGWAEVKRLVFGESEVE